MQLVGELKMEIKDYCKKNDAGEYVLDETLMRQFISDLDRERSTASQTASANTEKRIRAEIEKQVREQIQAEAAMTAEQKFQAERDAFEKQKKQLMDDIAAQRKALYKEKISGLYTADGLFTDKEAEAFCALITDNFDESVAYAQALVSERKQSKEAYKQAILKDIQSGQGNPTGNGSSSSGDSSAVMRAKAINAEQNSNKEVTL